MFLFHCRNRLLYKIDSGATEFYWITICFSHKIKVTWPTFIVPFDFKKLLTAICFHYKKKGSSDILQNIFFCVSQKYTIFFFFCASSHTGLKQHEGEEIMTIFIFWWTIHANMKNLKLQNPTIKLHYGVSVAEWLKTLIRFENVLHELNTIVCLIKAFNFKTLQRLWIRKQFLNITSSITWRKAIWSSVCESSPNSPCLFFSSVISCSSCWRSASAWLTAALSWPRISSFTSARRRSMEHTSSVKMRSLSSRAVCAESWEETKAKR